MPNLKAFAPLNTDLAFIEFGGAVDLTGAVISVRTDDARQDFIGDFRPDGFGGISGRIFTFQSFKDDEITLQVTRLNLNAAQTFRILQTGDIDRAFETALALDDQIDLSPGRDKLSGLGGDDRISGRAGNDTLSGGEGRDTLFGGGGADALRGDDADDVLFGGAGRDRLFGGSGDDTLRGQGGDDRLRGGKSDDLLRGHGGDDRLLGGAGDDTLAGGGGRSLLTGGGDADRFLFTARRGAAVVTDFQPGEDKLVISRAAGLDDLEVSGGDDRTVISYDAYMIVLRGVAPDELQSGDFLF